MTESARKTLSFVLQTCHLLSHSAQAVVAAVVSRYSKPKMNVRDSSKMHIILHYYGNSVILSFWFVCCMAAANVVASAMIACLDIRLSFSHSNVMFLDMSLSIHI